MKRPTLAYIGGPLDGREFKDCPFPSAAKFSFLFKCGCIDFADEDLAPEHDHPCLAIYEFEEVVSTDVRWVYVLRQENPVLDLLDVHDEVPDVVLA